MTKGFKELTGESASGMKFQLSGHVQGAEIEALILIFPIDGQHLRRLLIQERDRLDSGNFKALAAAYVLAHDHVVATHHVRLRLGKLGAVALVGASRELLLLGPHQP